jgi:hypothetical protein
MYKLVTCPETAHLEKIDFDRHPLGILIRACSRFSPVCEVHCARTCAARMDRRARLSSRPATDEELDLPTGSNPEFGCVDSTSRTRT